MILVLQITLIIFGVIFGIGTVAESKAQEKRFLFIAMVVCFALLLASVKL